jgi:hypothetical protein
MSRRDGSHGPGGEVLRSFEVASVAQQLLISVPTATYDI